MAVQLLLNSLTVIAHVALVATGFSLLFATARFYNFAYGGVYAIGAYGGFVARNFLNAAPITAILFGATVATAFGWSLHFFLFAPLRNRGASPLGLMLASMGAYVVAQNLISVAFGDSTRSLGASLDVYRFLGGYVAKSNAGLIIVVAALLTSNGLILRTRLGLGIRALAGNAFLAKCVGIPTGRVAATAVCIASFMAGTAGTLVGYDVGVTPRMGFRPVLLGMVACIVGGMGSQRGAVIGAVIVGIAMELGTIPLGSRWQDAIAFGLMTSVLLLRPSGICGTQMEIGDRSN